MSSSCAHLIYRTAYDDFNDDLTNGKIIYACINITSSTTITQSSCRSTKPSLHRSTSEPVHGREVRARGGARRSGTGSRLAASLVHTSGDNAYIQACEGHSRSKTARSLIAIGESLSKRVMTHAVDHASLSPSLSCTAHRSVGSVDSVTSSSSASHTCAGCAGRFNLGGARSDLGGGRSDLGCSRSDLVGGRSHLAHRR